MLRLLVVFIHFLLLASANVEKTIFVAPPAVTLPQDAAIDNLLLEPLHPERLSVRTFFNASFPTDDKPHGDESWALLEGLSPRQRHELRICWLATQPTAFQIDTFTMAEAFETAELIISLTTYSYARHAQLSAAEIDALKANRFKTPGGSDRSSVLFLRVQAAADYFSLNKTLMENVPPVHVDLILDPYLFNVFPISLLPTAGYIIVVAVSAWFISVVVYQLMAAYIQRNEPSGAPEVEDKKTQ
ncbi:hypothetical protein PMZ80_009695 [Knufia obscura]|uniref:GPI transamidase component PIG-T n=2 Tax=Knufia TaxID=430999 RepID=A0AAN8EFT3_9EURO|nr:hypothetical protein PMZ80_009695 [Knufia obscura]KAK5949737.1 hypothetical protein OHC33_009334 [Knufia fluminis]